MVAFGIKMCGKSTFGSIHCGDLVRNNGAAASTILHLKQSPSRQQTVSSTLRLCCLFVDSSGTREHRLDVVTAADKFSMSYHFISSFSTSGHIHQARFGLQYCGEYP